MLSVPGTCSSDRTTSYGTNERKTELGANIDIMEERTANTLCFSCVGRVVLCWMLVFIFSRYVVWRHSNYIPSVTTNTGHYQTSAGDMLPPNKKILDANIACQLQFYMLISTLMYYIQAMLLLAPCCTSKPSIIKLA